MRPRYLAPVAIVVLLLLARMWMATAGTTPAGQPPLADVHTLDALRAEFNRDAAKMRVILSLAPTCPYCLKGGTGIDRLLARYLPATRTTRWSSTTSGNRSCPPIGASPDPARSRASRTRACVSSGTVSGSWRGPSSTRRRAEPSSRTAASSRIWWDFIAVYPPGGHWTDTLPEPLLLDGTVDDAIPAFEALLTKAYNPSAR